MFSWLFIVENFRDLDSWKKARSVVCALLEMSASLSRSAEHTGLARSLNTISVAILDNMAKGYEGERRSFLVARSLVDQLEELLSRSQASGLPKGSELIPLGRELNRLRKSLDGSVRQLR